MPTHIIAYSDRDYTTVRTHVTGDWIPELGAQVPIGATYLIDGAPGGVGSDGEIFRVTAIFPDGSQMAKFIELNDATNEFYGHDNDTFDCFIHACVDAGKKVAMATTHATGSGEELI